MSDIPSGYRDIPEEDRKKAKTFFDRGSTVAGTGQFDYAIEMYLSGLNLDPEAVDAHQALRDISLKRKASGGKALGMFAAMKIKTNTKDEKANMLAAEKLLAFDPGNTDHMLTLMDNAHKSGCWDTALWIGPILHRANSDSPKPDFNKYIALRDIYVSLGQWQQATDACQAAAVLKPDDMDLQTELKNLGAQQTMKQGGYGSGGSFRNSIRNMDAQRKLMESDMDVRSEDVLTRQVAEAKVEYDAEPEVPGKIMKYVDALIRTELPANEELAIETLSKAFERTKQFRFRLARGQIRLKQLTKQEREWRTKYKANPEELKEEFQQFLVQKTEEELSEFTLWAENYPTDLSYKYEMAKRMFTLQRFSEAIPVLQTARQDPKVRAEATIFLSRSFLEAGFVDEAVETMRTLIEDYPVKGDTKSKEMYYWYARALEQQNDNATAIKSYSQLAQWDFNYRDVQARIKRLRAAAAGNGGNGGT